MILGMANVAAGVTGAGDKAFSAGGDLLEFNNQLQSNPRKLIETLAYNQRVFARLEALPVPVIGAVNGTAVNASLMACHAALYFSVAACASIMAASSVSVTGSLTVLRVLCLLLPPEFELEAAWFAAALLLVVGRDGAVRTELAVLRLARVGAWAGTAKTGAGSTITEGVLA